MSMVKWSDVAFRLDEFSGLRYDGADFMLG
jgi:hypothetical protein